MKTPGSSSVIMALAAMLAALIAPPAAAARQSAFPRLGADLFDAASPAERIVGAPGAMTIQGRACRTLETGETRRRIVDVAVQEWGFFGFTVVDQTEVDDEDFPFSGRGFDTAGERGRFGPRLTPEESVRVAPSIAGYWAVTPEGAGIVARQNESWESRRALEGRWVEPWSAAFISWVMCEAGLGATGQFQRAIAHRIYIDQAIRARDDGAPGAAFAAYDIGETTISPGDLLCSSRRPAYRNIAERRRQMGVGARSHCDVVVKVDEAGGRILAVGGNVRRSVSLKLLPAAREPERNFRPVVVDPERPLFVHLKLRAEPIEAHALDTSPTARALACARDFQPPALLSVALPGVGVPRVGRC